MLIYQIQLKLREKSTSNKAKIEYSVTNIN